MGSYRPLAIPVPIALILILFAGCGESVEIAPATLPPPDEEKILSDLPFAQIIEAAFGVTGLVEERSTLVAADGSRFRPLGQLIGQLTSRSFLARAAFVDYQPSEAGAIGEGAGRDRGVYMVAVSLDAGGRPQYGPLSVLTATGESILAREEAIREGLSPFRQETLELETTVSVFPALLVDLDGDGIEEIALARRFRRPELSWQRYEAYQRAPAAERWTRVGQDGEATAPGLAALDYWANVAAATAVAGRWDPRTRLVTVWSWLTEEGAPVTPELLRELVPDGDPEEARKTQEALTQMRSFFEDAHARFSLAFRTRQPWPGFINGFKKTEGVDVLSVSPPSPIAEGETSLDVLVNIAEREGPDAIARRFLVTMRVAQESEEWFLDGVEAAEQREAEPP